ncbi:MAG TPA: hypothetical protein VN764_15915, partial [Polyangiaceae bacterium]|nr:hypothetical protein [Polyangiaceae bacterium]
MCAIDYEGVVLCWGDNTWGQLGTDQVPVGQSSATPVYVQGVSSVDHLTSGRDHICAITSNAEIACWGHNNYGQLGMGSADSNPHLPTTLPFSDALQVSAAGDYTCALVGSDGASLLCWGYGAEGQLGYSTIQACDSSSFCSDATDGFVSGLMSYPNYVWTGERHACARITSGELFCWGSDVDKALPLSGAVYNSPQLMPTDVYATRSLGDSFSCGVNAGYAYCWGRNDDMQTGQLTTPFYDDKVGLARFASPAAVALVPNLPLMDQVSAGAKHACGVSIAQDVYCWGYNEGGRVGRNDVYTVVVGQNQFYSASLPPGLVSTAVLEPDPNQ